MLIELRAQRDNLSLQIHVIYKLAKIVSVVAANASRCALFRRHACFPLGFLQVAHSPHLDWEGPLGG